jgi:hypothetical protein
MGVVKPDDSNLEIQLLELVRELAHERRVSLTLARSLALSLSRSLALTPTHMCVYINAEHEGCRYAHT